MNAENADKGKERELEKLVGKRWSRLVAVTS